MTDQPSPPREPWGRPRWWGWVAAIFVVQLILIAVLSTRSPSSAASTSPPHRVTLVTDAAAGSRPASEPWWDDPAQVALVSPRGFSGPVWRQLPNVEPGWLARTDRPQWLTQELSLSASTLVSTGGDLPMVFMATAPPRAFLGATSTVPGAPSSASMARVEGDLAKRRRLDAPELPTWEHQDVLAATAVQLLVDGDGNVLAATLLSRSGHPAADERALALARAARFEPAADPSNSTALTWGQLIFQWQAVPSRTNAP